MPNKSMQNDRMNSKQFPYPEDPAFTFIKRRPELRWIYEMPYDKVLSEESLKKFVLPENKVLHFAKQEDWQVDNLTADIRFEMGYVIFDPPISTQSDNREKFERLSSLHGEDMAKRIGPAINAAYEELPEPTKSICLEIRSLKSHVYLKAVEGVSALDMYCQVTAMLRPEMSRKELEESFHQMQDKATFEHHEELRRTDPVFRCGCDLCKTREN